jgi:hypothetical protein
MTYKHTCSCDEKIPYQVDLKMKPPHIDGFAHCPKCKREQDLGKILKTVMEMDDVIWQ